MPTFLFPVRKRVQTELPQVSLCTLICHLQYLPQGESGFFFFFKAKETFCQSTAKYIEPALHLKNGTLLNVKVPSFPFFSPLKDS